MTDQNSLAAALADCKLVGFAVTHQPETSDVRPSASSASQTKSGIGKIGTQKTGSAKPGVSKAGGPRKL